MTDKPSKGDLLPTESLCGMGVRRQQNQQTAEVAFVRRGAVSSAGDGNGAAVDPVTPRILGAFLRADSPASTSIYYDYCLLRFADDSLIFPMVPRKKSGNYIEYMRRCSMFVGPRIS